MSDATIHLLADRPGLTEAVGMMRWQEWGRAPEPEDPNWWIDATRRESGRDALPVTYIAVDDSGELAGAAGLGKYDIPERQDRSPWVLGMVVRADLRGVGIGRRLLRRLERHARGLGFESIWVANEGRAVDFYQSCGYRYVESSTLARGVTTHVLTRLFEPRAGAP